VLSSEAIYPKLRRYAVETFRDCRYLGTRICADGTVGDYKWMTYGEASTNRTAIGSGLIYHGIPEVSHNGRNKYRPSFFN
jgi:long-chain acyl-CoA synthetase